MREALCLWEYHDVLGQFPQAANDVNAIDSQQNLSKTQRLYRYHVYSALNSTIDRETKQEGRSLRDGGNTFRAAFHNILMLLTLCTLTRASVLSMYCQIIQGGELARRHSKGNHHGRISLCSLFL